jgi:hypothetical protein
VADDGSDDWTPYLCFHIEGDPNHAKLTPHAFRREQTRVGEPISFLKLLYVDRRTQYRATRDREGNALYMMENRCSEDLQRRVAKVWSIDGSAAVEKHLIRDPGPAPDWPRWAQWPE